MWLYLPSNSSQEPACSAREFELGSPIWASNIAPFATLSGKLTPPQSWLRACKKARWMRLVSGPMYAPSTLQRSAAEWIASLPGSRAKTLASQGVGPGSTASAAACSSKSFGSQAIAVRGASFWRTSQASLLPPPPLWTRPKASSTSVRPPESWENWPTSGGIRSGSLFQRPMWVPAMAGRVGSALPGAWPTPAGMPGMDLNGKAGAGGEFAQQATNWTTPSASDGDRGGRLTDNMSGTSLTQQVASIWATPKASDGTKGGPNQQGSKGDLMLPSQACQWPTPTAQDSEQSGGPNAHHLTMHRVATTWPTPAARDSKGPNSEEHATVTGGGRKHMDQLANFVAYSPLAQTTRDGQTSLPDFPKSPRHLNPLFGAWLMGWPSTWVIAEPHASSASETVLWRHQLQSHLSYLLDEPESLNKEAA